MLKAVFQFLKHIDKLSLLKSDFSFSNFSSVIVILMHFTEIRMVIDELEYIKKCFR